MQGNWKRLASIKEGIDAATHVFNGYDGNGNTKDGRHPYRGVPCCVRWRTSMSKSGYDCEVLVAPQLIAGQLVDAYKGSTSIAHGVDMDNAFAVLMKCVELMVQEEWGYVDSEGLLWFKCEANYTDELTKLEK
jgi:hypothetical protein